MEMQFERLNQINMVDLLNEHTVWMQTLWLLKSLDQQILLVRVKTYLYLLPVPKYQAEVSVNLLVAFLNGIAELIENRAFISWNPIDEYVWAEDSNFQFQKIKSEYYSNSIIHKELLTS